MSLREWKMRGKGGGLSEDEMNMVFLCFKFADMQAQTFCLSFIVFSHLGKF